MKNNNNKFRNILVVFVVLTIFTGVSAAVQSKVTICHNQAEKLEIDISEAALQVHLDHGDTIGECQIPIPPAPELSTTILMSAGLMGLVGFSRLKRNR